MPYTVSYDKSDNLVILTISGTDTYKDWCKARDEALGLCDEKHCSRLLVDLREFQNNRPSVFECFFFGQALSRARLPFYVAHVMPIDITVREDIRFISTVAVNRGVTINEFESIEKARTWLLDEIGRPIKVNVKNGSGNRAGIHF
jgi:hypothetical protein